MLMLTLKRHSWSGGPAKVSRPVATPSTLDLRPFTVDPGSPLLYELIGVAVHDGDAARGHTYCFVKEPSGVWSRADDADVRGASAAAVLAAQGYMLLYQRRVDAADRADDAAAPVTTMPLTGVARTAGTAAASAALTAVPGGAGAGAGAGAATAVTAGAGSGSGTAIPSSMSIHLRPAQLPGGRCVSSCLAMRVTLCVM
jgi:hypothetical protein